MLLSKLSCELLLCGMGNRSDEEPVQLFEMEGLRPCEVGEIGRETWEWGSMRCNTARLLPKPQGGPRANEQSKGSVRGTDTECLRR